MYAARPTLSPRTYVDGETLRLLFDVERVRSLTPRRSLHDESLDSTIRGSRPPPISSTVEELYKVSTQEKLAPMFVAASTTQILGSLDIRNPSCDSRRRKGATSACDTTLRDSRKRARYLVTQAA